MRVSTNPDVAVLVFSRAPVPGQVKTRLIPRLGEWRAARLHARLTRHALHTARAAACGPVELYDTSRQRGADLGERMHHALERTLRRHRGAIIIGADCPALRPRDLRRTARWLAGGSDVVLAPAEDGGYALIGAKRVTPFLFSGIAWGGPDVYESTMRKLVSLGYRWRSLQRIWDVDRPEDLERLDWVRFSLRVGAVHSWTASGGPRRARPA